MKLIRKNPTPQELTTYKSITGANYKDLIRNHSDIADIVRLSLTDAKPVPAFHPHE